MCSLLDACIFSLRVQVPNYHIYTHNNLYSLTNNIIRNRSTKFVSILGPLGIRDLDREEDLQQGFEVLDFKGLQAGVVIMRMGLGRNRGLHQDLSGCTGQWPESMSKSRVLC